MITTEQIKALREQTGISVMQCKSALEEAGGDMEKAIMVLKKKGKDIAAKKSERSLGAGVIASYIHSTGTVGVMLELSCETDFVAKNEDFKKLAYDIAMHVAATNPEFLSLDDISDEQKSKMEELFKKEVEESGKPDDIKKKMLQGKMDAYFNEKTLLEQSFIKDGDMTITGLIEGAVQKFGENTVVARYTRYAISK